MVPCSNWIQTRSGYNPDRLTRTCYKDVTEVSGHRRLTLLERCLLYDPLLEDRDDVLDFAPARVFLKFAVRKPQTFL